MLYDFDSFDSATDFYDTSGIGIPEAEGIGISKYRCIKRKVLI